MVIKKMKDRAHRKGPRWAGTVIFGMEFRDGRPTGAIRQVGVEASPLAKLSTGRPGTGKTQRKRSGNDLVSE